MQSPVRQQSVMQGLNWTQIQGAASEVAAAPDGSLWALSTEPAGPDKYIWHFANGTWTNISGLAEHLSVALSGIVYAVNSGGGTYAYSSGAWAALGGGAVAITAASDGSIYVLSNAGGAADKAIWHNVAGRWTQVPGSGVAIAASWDKEYFAGPFPGGSGAIKPGGIYILNSAGSIYYENTDGTFALLPGSASAIEPISMGAVFVLGYPVNGGGNPVYYYDLSAGNWTAESGAGTSLSSDSSHLYVVNSSGAIYSTSVAAYIASTPVPSPPPTPVPGATMPPAGSTITAYLATAPPTQYVDYAANGYGYGIATTPDGSIYVTQEQSGNPAQIVKINGSSWNVITMPQYFYSAGLSVRGADGAIWFSDQLYSGTPPVYDYMARLDPSGTFTEYAIPWTNSAPFGMTLGPDGNVWFTEFYAGRIGRITPQGALTDYSLGSSTHRPSGIALGPDGNFWVAESAGTTIERMSPSGTLLATYPVNIQAYHIVAAPDGNMWFVDAHNGIGRIDMNGNSQTWNLPCDVPGVGNFCNPGYFEGDTDIVIGPGGNIWFPAQNFQAIARMTLAGYLTEWYVPPGNNVEASPYHATTYGSDILFVGGGNRMVRVTP